MMRLVEPHYLLRLAALRSYQCLMQKGHAVLLPIVLITHLYQNRKITLARLPFVILFELNRFRLTQLYFSFDNSHVETVRVRGGVFGSTVLY